MGWTEQIVSISEEFDEFRRVGTEGDAAVRQWIVDELAQNGVDAVDETYDVETRHCRSWHLSVDGHEVPSFFMNGAAFTGPDGVRSEMLYIGDSLLREVDIAGKIVVMDLQCGPVLPGRAVGAVADYVYDPGEVMASGTFGGQGGPAPRNFPAPYYEAADRGAVGFIAILAGREADDDRFFADPTARVHPRIPGVFPQGVGRSGAERSPGDGGDRGIADARRRGEGIDVGQRRRSHRRPEVGRDHRQHTP